MALNIQFLLLLILSLAINFLTAEKYSDENRPYKFGFNIQGYQHRQEEKDDKGIIRGEYGFITADGYYRVTVYATDENGDFKILSMKNYYVGFPPEDPTTTLQTPAAKEVVKSQPNSNLSSPEKKTSKTFEIPKEPFPNSLPKISCSDCWVPKSTQKPKTNQMTHNFFGGGELKSNNTRNNKLGIQSPSLQYKNTFAPHYPSNELPATEKVTNLKSNSLNTQVFPKKFLTKHPVPNSKLKDNSHNCICDSTDSFTYEDPFRNSGLYGPKSESRERRVRNGLPPGVTVEDIQHLFHLTASMEKWGKKGRQGQKTEL